jgi:hypothetical protein
MKPIEFDTELQGNAFLSIPQEVAARLPKTGHAKVIVYVDDGDSGDAQWRKASYERFMKEDSPEDSVYDDSL